MHAESHRSSGSNCAWIGMAEDNPEANPSDCKAEVHGIAHIAIETDDHQTPGRNHWSRRAVSGPPEIPHAAQGHREAQHGGNRSQPTPARGTCQFHIKAEPLR